MYFSREKTEDMTVQSGEGGEAGGGDSTECSVTKKVEVFKYLGSVFQINGDIDAYVTHRNKAGWAKWS